MPAISNDNYSIVNGLTVYARSGTSPTNKVHAISDGVIKNRATDITTSVGSGNVTLTAVSADALKRIDVIYYDVSTSAYGVKTGTEVASTATASIPTLTSTSQIALATVPLSRSGSTTTIATFSDARSTTQYLPIRSFNRTQSVRIAKQRILPTVTSYIDINDSKVRKQFSYHSAIGAVYTAGDFSDTNSNTVIITGGVVTSTGAGSFNSSAGELFIRDIGTYVTIAAGSTVALDTVAEVTASNTFRKDAVYVDNASGVVGTAKGTLVTQASGSVDLGTVSGVAPSVRTLLGYLYIVGNATVGSITYNFVDARPRP